MHILFCCTNWKNVLQKEIKDWTFEIYVVAGSTLMSLNVLSNREGLDWLLLPNVLPKLSKITVTYSKSVKINERVNSDLLKVKNMTINFELLTVSKMTSLKIYISRVMEKAETSNLDTR